MTSLYLPKPYSSSWWRRRVPSRSYDDGSPVKLNPWGFCSKLTALAGHASTHLAQPMQALGSTRPREARPGGRARRWLFSFPIPKSYSLRNSIGQTPAHSLMQPLQSFSSTNLGLPYARDLEVAHRALNVCDFGVGHEGYVGVVENLRHFWS